jgi:hypothetical protein
MKERPILYSAPMVLALLAKRKTQTRRLVKPQTGHRPLGWGSAENGADRALAVKPYARVGDRLWGRETFATVGPPHVAYRADGSCLTRVDNGGEWELWHGGYLMGVAKHDKIGHWWTLPKFGGKWKPSIFMPRWASRLLHEVTAVRVERLSEITEADAIAEGITEAVGRDRPAALGPGKVWTWPGSDKLYVNPRAAYFAGWDSINGKGSAAKNPYVWVVTFRDVAQPPQRQR